MACTILTLGFVACENPYEPITPDPTITSLGTPANNEIWFTTSDGKELMGIDDTAFNANITNIEHSEFGISVIIFDAPLTTIGAGAFDARGTSRNLSNISLPESVTSIEEYAFYECTNLECITLGSKIRSCGSQAFDLCVELNSLHISSVEDWCQIEFANPTANPLYFSNCLIVNGTRLSNIIVPSQVSHIGDYAFYNYASMTSVNISADVESIGKSAFEGCEKLSKVNIENISAWCGITFENESSNPLSIAKNLYINNLPATTLLLEGVEAISPRAFQGCNNIASLIADNSLKTIGEEAFRGCMGLTLIELGNAISSIDGKAFMGCSALKIATIMNPEPPILGDKYVFDYNAEDRKIYVPQWSYNAYVAAPLWSKYADSLEGI